MFRDIKVGDWVIVRNWRSISRREVRKIGKVSKITANYFDVDNIRYRKSDGKAAGDYDSYNIKPYTEEEAAEIRRNIQRDDNIYLISNLKDSELRNMSPEDLQAIADIINKYK